MKNDVLTSYPTFPQSLSTSTAQRQQGTSVCMPCPAHVATFYLRESHHHHHHRYQTLYCGLYRSGLQLCGNLRCYIRAVGWMEYNVKTSLVMASRVFKLVCCLALSCWSTISDGFLWGWTHMKLSRVLSALSCIITSTSITPSPSHETVTFPAHRHFMNLFFQGDWGWCHSMDCIFFPVQNDGPRFQLK